ncbi:MAG TPA: glycosyltransferase [Candidatus Binatia bacterium]|nr:glycosyltransferase [Candidatus Binatia bacterium]
MDFSVIVPVYNAEKTVDRCIDALLAQDYPRSKIEILMVDNNSSDRSAERMGRRVGIRVLSEPRQSPYIARNLALTASRGDVVAFTDADCAPRPCWLSALARTLEATDALVALGRLVIAGRSPALRALGAYESAKDAYILESDQPELYYGHAGNMAVRRRVFEQIGPFEERARGGDTIFVRRVVDRFSTRSVAYSADAVVERLEFDSVGPYLRKLAAYGRSCRRYGRVVVARPLSVRQRWEVYRHMVREGELSVGRSAMLLAILGLGFGAWYLGNLSASLRVEKGGVI